MKKIIYLCFLLPFSLVTAQSLPIDFETAITTSDFIDFDGGTATVIDNPQVNGINTSGKVAQIIRNGGAIFAGSKIDLAANLDFSTLSGLTMKVYTSAPVGTVVKFKLESVNGSTERDVTTTVSNQWETLTWDFTGTPTSFNSIVFMFDFGTIGNGSANSTFLFDDIQQLFTGFQIDLPVTFDEPDVNYTTTSFEGAQSFPDVDPTDATNNVVRVLKGIGAGSSGGTTIGTPGGFATDIPLSLTDSKMTVRVWSPDAGIPVRLKVEKAGVPTQTCETQVNTTVAGQWETLEFDFTNEATGTAALSFGLNNGWTYSMASIFFNFGTSGAAAGEKTYYFDDVRFGPLMVNTSNYEIAGLEVYPNPANDWWSISADQLEIVTIDLFDLSGKKIQSLTPAVFPVIVDASQLTPGLYLAKLTTTQGTQTIRLIKQ